MTWQEYDKFFEKEMDQLQNIEAKILPLIAEKLRERLQTQQSKVRNFLIVI